MPLMYNHRVRQYSLQVNGWPPCLLGLRSVTLILLTWRIWWDPNNDSKWQIGFNWAFKGLRQWNSSLIDRVKLRNNVGTCLPVCAVSHRRRKQFSFYYGHVPHNDVSVNNGPHNDGGPIRLWYYKTYHCGTVAYSIQYSNKLDRFVA